MAKVSLRAYNQEIETMIDRGHLDEAIAHCRHILKTFPKHLETYRLLGKAYLEYKRYPEAADIFSRVLVAVPNDFVANVGMSIIRDEENRLDEAIWHMERAFETQPSNAAIQGELQRLYGRREGMQPPRIRMTRGALAHMYVGGELYPQAISEIKSVLKDDPGRNDMQVLLARAYFRSGLRNDAAEVASAVLRNNPYNLDANRVLVEILGADHPESVHAYRQRVVELDPYAAQVTGSIFMSNEVPDAAVSLEHLDWNGQPVGLQPDWQTARAISLEGEPPQEEQQPDWLKSAFGQEVPPRSSQPENVSPFDAAVPPAQPVAPADEIPDFLRDAGWRPSTGAFDESKLAFADAEREPSSSEPAIEQGDLPDWVKAMAPQQPAETPAAEEELPDWINQIGASALPAAAEAADQLDWLKDSGQPPAQQPAEEQPDWLNQLAQPEQPATPAAAEEPDWLKGFGSATEPAPSDASAGELDWLTQLSQETGAESRSFEAAPSEFDFLNQPVEPLDAGSPTPAADIPEALGEPGIQPEAASLSSSADEFDFLDPLGSQFRRTPAASSEDFDFLNELTKDSEQLAPSSTPELAKPGPLGMSEEEQDDSFAWLESLAAKQGATEGLLTKPEDRLEEEPDWIRQAKSMEETSAAQPPMEQPPIAEPAASLEGLGMSEEEQDDSFAWLESLAAKQGATEGLLTKPEERLEDEPEWVRQAKRLDTQAQEAPVEQTPEIEQPAVSEPASSVEGLGTTEQEREDSFAWLEALAAKQGASEGLLTRPEERPEEEPEWVKQARDLGEASAAEPAPEPTPAVDEIDVWLQNLEGERAVPEREAGLEEQPAEMKQPEEVPVQEPSTIFFEAEQVTEKDDTDAWIQSLDAQAALSQPEHPAEEGVAAEDTVTWLQNLDQEKSVPEEEISSSDDTAIWLKGLGEEERVVPEPAQQMQPDELPAWLENIEEEADQTQVGIPAIQEPAAELPEAAEWMGAIEEKPEPVAPDVPKVDTGALPSWLRGLEEEESEPAIFGSQEDLPAWLQGETVEPLAEPTRIEPTHAADWHPIEVEAGQPELEPMALEPVMEESVSQEAVAPPPQQPEPVDVVAIIEEKIAEPEPETVAAAPKSQKEPVRKVTGALADPILGQARGELNRSNVSGALDSYGRLIKKGRLLEDIIYDLREASYRYPVDVGIWQSLGDAYMRANRLQDALDAYTKAEELLR
jgi:cytochrome c-type biogenesis protein CcmH/NrfG